MSQTEYKDNEIEVDERKGMTATTTRRTAAIPFAADHADECNAGYTRAVLEPNSNVVMLLAAVG